MSATDYFDAGFTAQLSVTPPNAKISPNSKLSAKDAGKAPGVLGAYGQYHGYDWRHSAPTRATVEAWKAGGANIGFLSSSYPAIDIDILREDIADAVVATVESIMGDCLVRTGRHPKRLLVFRCDAPLRTSLMHYARWSDLLGEEERLLIEFLGTGRQYVMDGIHPVTMKPYTIKDPLMALTLGPLALPTLTIEKTEEVFDAIEKTMGDFGYDATTKIGQKLIAEDIEQDSLKAPSQEELMDLVSRAPNSVPDREDYVSFGYAVKGASQEFPELGFDLFMDWCQRWTDGANDPEQVERDWGKMSPPYRSGYYWLLDTVKTWNVNVSDLEFGTAEEPEPGTLDPAITASREALTESASFERFSDSWLVEDFAAKNKGKLLAPVGLPGTVFVWNGVRWEDQHKNALNRAVERYLKSMTELVRMSASSPEEGTAGAMRMGSVKLQETIARAVVRSQGLSCEVKTLDVDPDIINTLSGPVSLTSGKRIEPDPAMLQTKVTGCRFDPDATCPLWERFIDESTSGDKDTARTLQMLAGYALTGHTRDQIMPFFIGGGGNGKSVFMTVLTDILHDYAITMPASMFQAGADSSGTDDYKLAKLPGARLISTSEVKLGAKWNDQRIKLLTGEDLIEGRRPYGEPFTFKSQASLIVVGNHQPSMDAISDAISRRMKIVPWDFKPKVMDSLLPAKLHQELAGIFNWCLAGARDWYQNGVVFSGACEWSTKGYLQEQDTMGEWAGRTLVQAGDGEKAFASTKQLHDSYKTWVRINTGDRPLEYQSFTQALPQTMIRFGAKRGRNGPKRGWVGVELLAQEDIPAGLYAENKSSR